MMSTLDSLQKQLKALGFLERGSGVFEAPDGSRMVGLGVGDAAPADWPNKVSEFLGTAQFGRAPIWSRYVVLVVESGLSPELRVAASAFSRDVSKCRRFVAFRGQSIEEVLPFVPLGPATGRVVSAAADLGALVAEVLGDAKLVEYFLDDSAPTARVSDLAEQLGEK